MKAMRVDQKTLNAIAVVQAFHPISGNVQRAEVVMLGNKEMVRFNTGPMYPLKQVKLKMIVAGAAACTN